MRSGQKLNWGLSQTWLRYWIIVVLALGITFRFVNLDRKIYWYDETLTSLTLSGYTQAEVVQQVFDGHPIKAAALQKYQQPNPEKGFGGTLHSLASDFPEHPPLYYLLLRGWVEVFGHSIAAIRSLSAVLSLLIFPALYWLCLQLFEKPLTAWVAVALVAASPYHLLYAQEAREYSFWTAIILFSSGLLLKALKQPNRWHWTAYAVTLMVGLYTYPFTALVAIGHGLYVVVLERRFSQPVRAYLVSWVAAIVGFAPWIVVLLGSRRIDAANWTAEPIPLPNLVKTWFGNLSRLFFDLNLDQSGSLLYLLPTVLIPLALATYALYYLWRQTPQTVWLFVFTLIGTTALALVLPDLIVGGQRSGVSRYLTPCYLGIQVAIAYLLSQKILSPKATHQKLWQLAILGVISAGIVSCTVSVQADAWWTKKTNLNNPKIAQLINQRPKPLVISNTNHFNVGEVICLSRLLDATVALQLIKGSNNMPQISSGFSDLFLLNPNETLRDTFSKNHYRVESIVAPQLWKITPLSP